MKIAYITADIKPNGNFTFFHDLLVNYPVPHPNWHHRVYLIQPNWDRGLVRNLKERGVEVRSCFEDFQPSTDAYWDKIRRDTEDCDVLMSGNITNLDEVLHDKIEKPIISISLAEKGYRSDTGGYGSFYKPRFHKAAVSKTAVNAFPEHVRNEVTVLYSGIDPGRLAQKVQRETVRRNWFPGRENEIKLAMFTGTHAESKGFQRLVAALDYLPSEWGALVLTPPMDLKVPPHLSQRVHFCNPTYSVADIYLAADCFVLPTEHEGLSMSLLEAWYLGVPVVTTRHNTMKELVAKHSDTEFGSLVDVEVTPEDLAKAIRESVGTTPNGAQKCVYKNYMASNMVDRWREFLESLTT